MTPDELREIVLNEDEMKALNDVGDWWAANCEDMGFPIPSDPLRSVIDLGCYIFMSKVSEALIAEAKESTKH